MGPAAPPFHNINCAPKLNNTSLIWLTVESDCHRFQVCFNHIVTSDSILHWYVTARDWLNYTSIGLALVSQYSREHRFYSQHLLPPALDGHYVRAQPTKRSNARTLRLPSVTQLIILLNTKWRNDATPHWNIINYRVLIFTQAAPPSPLTSLCSALLCTSLPCSISEASLARTGGKAVHGGAKWKSKSSAPPMHGRCTLTRPIPQSLQIGRRMRQREPRAFQTPSGLALITPPSIQLPPS